MHTWRKLSVFVAIVTVTPSFGLELGLVVDAATLNVKRFDTFTGTFMGSFGNGFLTNPMSVAIGPGGVAHVLDAVGSLGRVRRFDYNTGEYLGSVSISGFVIGSGSQLTIGTDGNYYASAGFASCTARISPVTGVAQGFFCSSGSNEFSVVEGSDGRIYSVDITGRIVASPKATFVGQFAAPWPFNGPVIANVNAPRQLQTFNNLLYWANSGNDTIGIANYAGGAIGSYNVNAQLDQTRCLAFAHGSTMYVGGFEVGSVVVGKILRVDALSGDQLGSFGTGYLQNPVSIAILAAPEPGSLIGFGLAVSLLLYGRRKK